MNHSSHGSFRVRFLASIGCLPLLKTGLGGTRVWLARGPAAPVRLEAGTAWIQSDPSCRALAVHQLGWGRGSLHPCRSHAAGSCTCTTALLSAPQLQYEHSFQLGESSSSVRTVSFPAPVELPSIWDLCPCIHCFLPALLLPSGCECSFPPEGSWMLLLCCTCRPRVASP